MILRPPVLRLSGRRDIYVKLVSIIIVLVAAAASAQPRYSVTDLGVLKGGNFSQGAAISDNQFVSGLSSVADGSQHAMIWYNGRAIDISKPGVLGPNSGAFGINS